MPKSCSRLNLALIFFLCVPILVVAQIQDNGKTVISPLSNVTAAFISPDTVCVNSPVTITNISSGVSSYFWNFCVSSINSMPTGDNLGNINGVFSLPVFSDYVIQDGNYYLFVVNNWPGSLIRLDFGNSMLNQPSVVQLGNFNGILSNNAEGIQVVNVNGKWIAIIVGGYPAGGTASQILKLDFGTDITNASPASINWGNLGNMNYPIDLHIFQENNNWYGLTLNSENQTITRFDFGIDFSTTPVASNLGNVGNLSGPTGIFAINDNGFWRVFITNGSDNSTITRLDYGSSLLNTPTVVELGNIGGVFRRPRDICIMKFCDELVGFVINGNTTDPQYANSLVRLKFKNGLGQMPEAEYLGNIGQLSFPHSISKLFRVGADLFSFITNVANNTITRLRFEGCVGVNIPNSTLSTPPTITYSVPGNYNINLLVDEGLPTQTSFCKTITVVGNSSIKFGNDTAICENSSLKLLPQYENVGNVIWSTGQKTRDITISTPGKYWASTNDGTSCSSSDTIRITSIPLPAFSLGKDTLLCENRNLILKPKVAADSYSWNTGESTPELTISSTGNYALKVSKAGCSYSDTIFIKKDPLGSVNLGNDTTLCSTPSMDLSYLSKPGDVVKWSTGYAGPTISVVNAGKYWIDVTNNSGCSGSDTIKVDIGKVPIFSLGPDTSKCLVTSIRLFSPINAEKYKWSTGNSSSYIDVNLPGSYALEITQGGCSYSDTINVADKPTPQINLGNDTLICKGENLLLDLNNVGNRLIWEDGSTNPQRTITGPGTYSVSVEISGCLATDEINIAERGGPIIYIGSDTALCYGQPFIIKPAVTGGTFKNWENGSETAIRTITEPGLYIGSAENICGLSFDTIQIKTGNGTSGTYNIPNAFSPNGDGKNDCFGVSKMVLKDLIEFSVFNRFGQKVFVGKNVTDCWDGKFNGKPQPEGAYVYIIRANTYCGMVDKKGIILITR